MAMRMYDLILKKRNGGSLSKEEIEYFVNGYTRGEIPDYQVSALMMAIYFQKMTDEETLDLTLAMADSGDKLDLSEIKGIKADKHSTGGVGDKTSLVLAPMIAALGLKMAKMSGRGLGHTGGTIDKLESFPGFRTALSEDEFIRNVSEVGMAITGQTGNLAPADKKMYALRDVTATVDNISLIASSIMSKKLAAGADVIVLDVKTGSGAFMKEEKDAFRLAEEMVQIGTGAGKKTVAVVSDMDQPLGYAVGNILEVIEAVDTLRGKGPKDLYELCEALGSCILTEAGAAPDRVTAEKMLREVISSGAALEKFAEFIRAQGGDDTFVCEPEKLLQVKEVHDVRAENSGYVFRILSDEIGTASMLLGGGRQTKDSVIDLSVGIVLKKKVGDYVEAGESLAVIYSNSGEKTKEAEERILASINISDTKPPVRPLIKGIVAAHK